MVLAQPIQHLEDVRQGVLGDVLLPLRTVKGHTKIGWGDIKQEETQR